MISHVKGNHRGKGKSSGRNPDGTRGSTSNLDSTGKPIIPLLTRADGSFHRFKKVLEDRLTIEYGSSLDLVLTGKTSLVKPDSTMFPDAEDLKRAKQHYVDSILEERADLPKMYGEIWSRISEPSKQLLRAQANFATTVEDKKDPTKLWEEIKNTHEGGCSVGGTEGKQRLIERFISFKQDENMDLHAFHQEFNSLVNLLEKNACMTFTTDAKVLASMFVDRLNSKFDEFKRITESRCVKNDGTKDAFYETVASAYSAAGIYINNVNDANPRYGGRLPPNNGKRTSGEPVFTARESHRGKAKKNIAVNRIGDELNYDNEGRMS